MTWMSAKEFRMFTDMALLVLALEHPELELSPEEEERAERAFLKNPPPTTYDNLDYPPPTSLQDYRERRKQSKGGFAS